MKIDGLYIKDFQQFKDFSLDLTYPKGHQKEGMPLDKICIIGQSATGKTTLLKKMINDKVKSIEDHFKSSYENISKNSSEFPEILFFPASDSIAPTIPLKGTIVNKIRVKEIWDSFKKLIRTHKENEVKQRVNFSKELEKVSDTRLVQLELDKLQKELKKNKSPLKKIAEKFDPILKNLNVKIKTEFEFESYENLEFLEIETLDQKAIPQNSWSSGVFKMIYKFIPLFVLEPKNTIILIDEPENSLYPDIQNQLIDFYKSFTVNCQFVYATHSPLIASNFEPWEVVELKYNDNGTVFREPYFRGKNHVDHYYINPKYLRYDEILTKVFDLETDSNDDRTSKLMEFSTLKDSVMKMKEEGASKEVLKEKVDELKKIHTLW